MQLNKLSEDQKARIFDLFSKLCEQIEGSPGDMALMALAFVVANILGDAKVTEAQVETKFHQLVNTMEELIASRREFKGGSNEYH